jgi:hypothetical protein
LEKLRWFTGPCSEFGVDEACMNFAVV